MAHCRGNQLNRGPRRVSLEFVGADKYSWGPSEWLVGEGGYQIRDRMGGLSIMLDRALVPGGLCQELLWDSFCRVTSDPSFEKLSLVW